MVAVVVVVMCRVGNHAVVFPNIIIIIIQTSNNNKKEEDLFLRLFFDLDLNLVVFVVIKAAVEMMEEILVVVVVVVVVVVWREKDVINETKINNIRNHRKKEIISASLIMVEMKKINSSFSSV